MILLVFGMVSIAFMSQMPSEKPKHSIKRVIRGVNVKHPGVDPLEPEPEPVVEPETVVEPVVEPEHEPGTMTDASNVVFKVSDKLDIENTVQTHRATN